MARGHTSNVCASLLKEHGSKKVYLLVLALAESIQLSRNLSSVKSGL